MLTQKECLNELEKSKLLTCSVVNRKGLVEYSCDFEDTSVFKIFEVLIKEHFELVEKYTLNCEFISEQHRVITRTFSYLEKYINPQPYKFEELYKGLWVWDDDKKQCIECAPGKNAMGEKCVWYWYDYDFEGELSEDYVEFEDGRFYPITKAHYYNQQRSVKNDK